MPRTFDYIYNDPTQAPANATIILSTYSKDESGEILISSICNTPEEVDWQVDILIKELEEIRSKLKRKLSE